MKGTLLEGNIRRELIQLALPLLVGNVLQQLYNTVDSIIIGHFLGTQAFSAVGVAGTIMNLFIFVLAGFCTGISILLAQLYGSGDRSSFRREVFISTSLGAAVTLVLSAIFLVLMRPVLYMINSPAELIGYIEEYLKIIIGGMLCSYLYNLGSGMLRAIGDTRAATFFLFVSVVVNAAADYLFVGVWQMGIGGAAWATVLSQLLAALCCMLYIFKRDRDLICTRYDIGFDRSLVKRTLSFGCTSALHQSSLYIGKIFVQGAVNLLGTPGIAAYTATMRVEGFSNSLGTSMGSALSVFVSQNHGAGKSQREKDGFKQGMGLALAMGVAFSALMFLLARPSMGWFLDAAEKQAIDYGADYMRMISIFYLLCFTGNTFVGFFRGVGRMRVLLIGTTLHITIRAVMSHMLVGTMGLQAVALATGVGWMCMTVYQIVCLFRWNRSIK